MMKIFLCAILFVSIHTAIGQVFFKHDLGETIVPLSPARVVVMDIGALEQLDYLGVDVIAVPTEVPAHLAKYRSEEYIQIGGAWQPDLAAVKRARPDFILYGATDSAIYAALSAIAPTVSYVENYSDYMANYVPYLKNLGLIFHKEAEVEAYLIDTYRAIQSLRYRSTGINKRGLILLYTQGRYHAFGEKSRFGLIHDEFGIVAASDTLGTDIRGKIVDDDFILKSDPDYIFMIDREQALGRVSDGRHHIISPAIQQTRAHRQGKVIWLDPTAWYFSGLGIHILRTKIKDVEQLFMYDHAGD